MTKVNEVSQLGSQPSPTAGDTWSRVARRGRVPLGCIFAVVCIWLARPTRTSLIAGTLVLLPGLVLRGLASGHVQKDKQLTISGPYAYTRNPLYLGSLMLAGGFAIAARSWWIFAAILLMFAVIYVLAIAAEYHYQRQPFPTSHPSPPPLPPLLPRPNTSQHSH